jgi:hypothetical protein
MSSYIGTEPLLPGGRAGARKVEARTPLSIEVNCSDCDKHGYFGSEETFNERGWRMFERDGKIVNLCAHCVRIEGEVTGGRKDDMFLRKPL